MNWHTIDWHTIEIIVIIAIIFVQFFILIKQLLKIHSFKKIFAPRYVVLPNNFTIIPQLHLWNEQNEDITEEHQMKEAVKSINTYLDHNYGSSVNFSIIEDIINRECDTRDEEISQGNNIPLYLGLAATMIGIIFGLLSMGSLSGLNFSNTETSSAFTQSIDSLIKGVYTAMFSSLCGLLITTVLSVIVYKNVKNKISMKQSQVLNTLQAELLLPANNNELQGVKQSIDDFSRRVVSIINRFESVSYTNARSAETINDALTKQLSVTEKIEGMSLPRLTQKTVELFSQLDNNMQVYRGFSDYLGQMQIIAQNMASFATRTNNIESLAEHFQNTLDESLNLTRFLNEHFKGIENVSLAALEVVDIADAHFREAIDKLSAEIDERIKTLNNESNNFENQVSDVFTAVGEQLQTITANHVNQLSQVYTSAIPNFRKLDKLDKLDNMSTSSQMTQLISAINNLNSKLDKIEQNTNGLVAFKPRPNIFKRLFSKFFKKKSDNKKK